MKARGAEKAVAATKGYLSSDSDDSDKLFYSHCAPSPLFLEGGVRTVV